jgi:2-(1,2-epoxy-1,2-dihydrophenyl)acetyl-CoA isomerase
MKTIKTEIRKNVGYITLNRPKRLNSFNIQLGEELFKILDKYCSIDKIRVIAIMGAGENFCAGGDVKDMNNAKDKPKYLRNLTKSIHKCVIKIREIEKPVIAVINGSAFGAGLSLALACDIIIADKDAKFGTAFIGVGLAPGCGTQFITNTLGYQKACEYILTSKIFNAKEAKEIGVVNRIVQRKNIKKVLDEFLFTFKKLPPIAIGKAKMLINKSQENDLISHLNLESETASYTAGTLDFNEGISAFIEKRKPIFVGK